VKRPGVRVRARRGYLALDPSRMLVPQPIKTPSMEPDPPALSASRPETTTAPTPAPLAGEVPAEAAVARRARPNAVEDVATLMRDPAGSASVRLAPPAVTTLAREGWAHYAKGDVEGARTLLAQAAIEGAPPWIFYALGQSEFALQNFPRAVDAWNTVRQRVPEFSEVYFDLADAHIQMQAYGAAAAVLRVAAGRWPENAEVFNALGVVLARREALDEAVESFRKAVALAPADALGHFNLARGLDIRYTKSLRYVAAMARWIGRDSDRTEAIAEYRRYLEIGGPQESSVRESLSRLEWRQ
jgi:tetratricopeptide (TPR) repeat protein